MAKHKFGRSSEGFTLIELLLVISVIALVASVVVSRVGSVEQEARVTVSISNLADVTRTIDAHVVRNKGRLPNGFDSLLSSADLTEIYPGNGVANQNNGVYDAWLTPGTLTTGEFTSLGRNLTPRADGTIYLDLYDHDPAATDANASTSNVAVRSTQLIPGASPVLPEVAIVNPTRVQGGVTVTSAVYQAFNLDPTDTSFRIVAFGVGPRCTLVGDRKAGFAEAPLIQDIAPNQEFGYHRPIVLVRVQNAGAYFAEVIGVVTSYGKNATALRAFLPK